MLPPSEQIAEVLNNLGVEGATYAPYIYLELLNYHQHDMAQSEALSRLAITLISWQWSEELVQQVIEGLGRLHDSSSIESLSSLAEVEDEELDAVNWVALAESVQQRLPTVSPPIIMQALERSWQIALNSLVSTVSMKTWGSLLSEIAVQLLSHALQQLDSCSPCRFLLASGCFRKDCQFDHELKSIPCRYWLQSMCIKSTDCQFSHDFDVPATLSATSIATQITKSTLAAMPPSSSSNTTDLADQFPSLPGSEKVKRSAQSKGKKEDLSDLIQFKYFSAHVQTTASVSSSSSRQAAARPDPVVASNGSGKMLGIASWLREHQFVPQASVASNRVVAHEWVSSGAELREDYEQLRAEARSYAIARNRLLEEATIAYRQGARDIAKRLSTEGQRLNDQMKLCHIQAAKSIFRKRNSLEQLQAGRVDFHGLHVAEALDCFQELFSMYRQYGMDKLSLITGSGHHTLGTRAGQAKLYPSLRNLCEGELGVKVVSDIKDSSGYVGGFIVSLR